MSKKMLTCFVVSLNICAILLSSCSHQPIGTPKQEIEIVNTSTPFSTKDSGRSTLEPTFLLDETLATSTPIPLQLKWPTKPVTSENANRIREINRWGRGSVTRIQRLHGNSDKHLILTPLGVYYYQTVVPYLLAFIPDANDFILSQDEKLLAVSMKNGNVGIWNMEGVSLQQTFIHSFPKEITEKIETNKLLPYYVGGMAFSPDSSEIAIGYVDGIIELWRIGESQPYSTIHHDSFPMSETEITLTFHLKYSPDGKVLVAFKYPAYGMANRLTFWSVPEAELISISDAGRFIEISEPAFLPDNRTLLVLSEDQSGVALNLWEFQIGVMVGKFGVGLSNIDSMELTSDGTQVTIYGSDVLGNYYRQVRKMSQGNLIENEKLDKIPDDEEQARINDFLLEQGHYHTAWLTGDDLKVARLGGIDNQEFRLLGESYWLTFPEGIIEPLNLPDDVSSPYIDAYNQLIAWCASGQLHLLYKEGDPVKYDLPTNSDCDGMTISRKKHYAAVWSDVSLYLINLETGKANNLKVEPQYRSKVLTAVFSHDEEILMGSRPGLITVLQIDPVQQLASSEYQKGTSTGNNSEITFSKDNSFAVALNAGTATNSDRTSHIKIWRVEDAVITRIINPPYIDSVQPKFISFVLSPDDKLIVSGDDFGGVRIWNVESGEEVANIEFDHRPLKLAFTPDGSGLIIVLGDGTVRLWGVP